MAIRAGSAAVIFAAWAALGWIASDVLADERGPVIEAIEGDRTVVVKTADGNRVAAVGAELRFGDRVKTGAKASVKMRFPDGSKLLIGRYSEVTIIPQTEGIQAISLARGEVRGVVRPSATVLQDPKSARIRFMIRTKAATLGVKGTDFVTQVQGDQAVSKFYTLDGSVQVARTEAEILAGKGTTIGAGMSARADETAIEAARPFNKEMYLEALASSQPDFGGLMKDDAGMVSQDSYVPEPEARVRRKSGLLAFQISGVFVKQETGGTFTTVQFSWVPVLYLKEWLALRGSAGALIMKANGDPDTQFVASEGMGFLGVRLGRFWLEPGAGIIGYPRSDGGTRNIVGLSVAYQLREEGLLDRLTLGVRAYDVELVGSAASSSSPTTVSTTHLLAGIGFRL